MLFRSSALDDLRTKIGLMGAALAALTQRELLIIRRRYLTEVAVTLEALGKELGVSKERVRQIESRAMRKMRDFVMPRYDGGFEGSHARSEERRVGKECRSRCPPYH